MEPYHRIVIEGEKFSPKFASRGSNKQWPIYTYRPKNMQNGRWSVDIVLRTSYAEVIFRHTNFAEKQGGMCWHQILARSITYLRWPQMEKWSSWRSSVLSIWTSLKFGSLQSDFISKAETMLKVLRSYIQSTVWLIKPPRQPQMEKLSTCIVFVSSKRSILI